MNIEEYKKTLNEYIDKYRDLTQRIKAIEDINCYESSDGEWIEPSLIDLVSDFLFEREGFPFEEMLISRTKELLEFKDLWHQLAKEYNRWNEAFEDFQRKYSTGYLPSKEKSDVKIFSVIEDKIVDRHYLQDNVFFNYIVYDNAPSDYKINSTIFASDGYEERTTSQDLAVMQKYGLEIRGKDLGLRNDLLKLRMMKMRLEYEDTPLFQSFYQAAPANDVLDSKSGCYRKERKRIVGDYLNYYFQRQSKENDEAIIKFVRYQRNMFQLWKNSYLPYDDVVINDEYGGDLIDFEDPHKDWKDFLFHPEFPFLGTTEFKDGGFYIKTCIDRDSLCTADGKSYEDCSMWQIPEPLKLSYSEIESQLERCLKSEANTNTIYTDSEKQDQKLIDLIWRIFIPDDENECRMLAKQFIAEIKTKRETKDITNVVKNWVREGIETKKSGIRVKKQTWSNLGKYLSQFHYYKHGRSQWNRDVSI